MRNYSYFFSEGIELWWEAGGVVLREVAFFVMLKFSQNFIEFYHMPKTLLGVVGLGKCKRWQREVLGFENLEIKRRKQHIFERKRKRA